MREKFDRNSPRVNIGLIGETTEDKIIKLEARIEKVKNSQMNKNEKEALIDEIDGYITALRAREEAIAAYKNRLGR